MFADFHYKKNMYASTVRHLNDILERANREDVDFVIHLGDFCNDYKNSPEVVNTYLNNKYGLSVFGIYGNHELESSDNSMQVVTPLLCNQNVNFGGEDVGYWYYDIEGFRLIGLDTNYSYNSEFGDWEHNRTASWGAPKDNLFENSLSPKQLDWLDNVLRDAKENDIKCLIFSHDSVSGEWHSTCDAESVRELFARYKGTVLMCLNGHLHTDHCCVKDNIAYFDVNSVLNGCWANTNGQHYSEDHTFEREAFDAEGNVVGVENYQLVNLTQGKNTWFFDGPLSAVVEINDDGEISIVGAETTWKYGVEPCENEEGRLGKSFFDGVMSRIKNRSVKLK